MSLTKQDLKEIKGLIDQSAKFTLSQTKDLIDQTAEDITINLSDKIDNTKQQIINEMDERFLAVDQRFEKLENNITREISDLADINRAVITRTDQIDHRLRIVERKLGLLTK